MANLETLKKTLRSADRTRSKKFFMAVRRSLLLYLKFFVKNSHFREDWEKPWKQNFWDFSELSLLSNQWPKSIWKCSLISADFCLKRSESEYSKSSFHSKAVFIRALTLILLGWRFSKSNNCSDFAVASGCWPSPPGAPGTRKMAAAAPAPINPTKPKTAKKIFALVDFRLYSV